MNLPHLHAPSPIAHICHRLYLSGELLISWATSRDSLNVLCKYSPVSCLMCLINGSSWTFMIVCEAEWQRVCNSWRQSHPPSGTTHAKQAGCLGDYTGCYSSGGALLFFKILIWGYVLGNDTAQQEGVRSSVGGVGWLGVSCHILRYLFALKLMGNRCKCQEAVHLACPCSYFT